MIEYINARLNEWVAWRVAGGHSNGLGFPKQAAFMRVAGSGSDRDYVPFIDEDASTTDRVMCVVKSYHSHLWRVVDAYYIRGLAVSIAARELGCCRDTVYTDVQRLHVIVKGYLEDIELGIALPEIAIAA